MSTNQERIRELALAGHSHTEIAAELGHLRPGTVRVYFSRITRSLGADERARMEQARAERPAGNSSSSGGYHRKFSDRRAISAEHIRIGRKLLQLRLDKEMTLGAFVEYFEFSNRVTLSAMEQGYHDFTLTEVKQIAAILDTTIEDLMCPPPGALAA